MSIEWDGRGLPPVGCECELYDCEVWNPVVIKYIGEKYVTTHRPDLNSEIVYCVAQRPEKFRPIRTEAELRRDHQIEALSQVLEYRAGCSAKPMAGWIIDTIAAGKIPGVKLEDV